MNKVVVVFAPTACGKTALARKIFGKSSLSCFKGMGEVISADSQAVYKGFDIGTAKPALCEIEDIPHHLVDVCDGNTQFDLGDFMEMADSLCREILSRNKIPLVVGGTGFYIRNFLLGSPVTPESNETIRSQVKLKLSQLGKKALYEELKIIDPEYASKINVNDELRICRALEVFYISGKPLSSYKLNTTLRNDFDFCPIILTRDKEDLYRRINERVDLMFEMGLEAEVKKLISLGYTWESPAMKAIGYSEFFYEGFTGKKLVERIKTDSRHYAKKQYTYMKGIPGAVEIHADDENKFLDTIKKFIGISLS